MICLLFPGRLASLRRRAHRGSVRVRLLLLLALSVEALGFGILDLGHRVLYISSYISLADGANQSIATTGAGAVGCHAGVRPEPSTPGVSLVRSQTTSLPSLECSTQNPLTKKRSRLTKSVLIARYGLQIRHRVVLEIMGCSMPVLGCMFTNKIYSRVVRFCILCKTPATTLAPLSAVPILRNCPQYVARHGGPEGKALTPIEVHVSRNFKYIY